ncbi:MAG: ATP-dependent protease LonB, partial [Clostridia bacterium]|nr:ATP-dependent protease LonB [Clostridia bacterium]
PGGIPIDGPSAGVAIATAIYSAITGRPVDNEVAMTGEISIRGEIKPVGGVAAKIEAAAAAGAKKILIPKENWQEIFQEYRDIQLLPVEDLEVVIEESLLDDGKVGIKPTSRLISASLL